MKEFVVIMYILQVKRPYLKTLKLIYAYTLLQWCCHRKKVKSKIKKKGKRPNRNLLTYKSYPLAVCPRVEQFSQNFQ